MLENIYFTMYFITEIVELSNKENHGINPIVQKDYYTS